MMLIYSNYLQAKFKREMNLLFIQVFSKHAAKSTCIPSCMMLGYECVCLRACMYEHQQTEIHLQYINSFTVW